MRRGVEVGSSVAVDFAADLDLAHEVYRVDARLAQPVAGKDEGLRAIQFGERALRD